MDEIDIKNEIKAVIYESGRSIKDIAEKMGMSTTNLSNMLSRRSIRYDIAKKIANVIGYKLKFKMKS